MERIKIKNICEVNPKQEILDDNFIISFIGMAQISNDNQFDTSILKKYEDVKKGFSSFKDGDILFAKITPCMENGKGVLIENLYNGIGFGSTEFHVLRPNIKVVDKKYLYWFTMYKKFRLNCEKNMTGSAGQKRVPKNYIENYEIKLPELIIQEKRAKILDNILKIKQEKLEQLKRLEELNKSIFIKLKLKNKNWDIKSFAEVTKVSQGLQIPISKRKKENGKNRFKYITIQFLNGSKEVEYIENPRENVICSEEDILMTRTGNTGMVVTGVSGVFHNNFFIVKYDKNILLKEYLVAYLNSKEVQEEIKKRAGTSTIPDLNHGEFYKIKILIPPINFQEKFSKQIQVIAKSKVEIQKSIEETQKLFDSLMEKYFG